MHVVTPSVLIVDDHPKLGTLVTALLNRLGFVDVDMASDGASAIEMAATKTYSLVICDLDMDTVDGFQVLQALRAAPETARIPFIMTEETFVHQDVTMAVGMGADGILLKPYDIDLFRAKIKQALRSAGKPRRLGVVATRREESLPLMLAGYNAA